MYQGLNMVNGKKQGRLEVKESGPELLSIILELRSFEHIKSKVYCKWTFGMNPRLYFRYPEAVRSKKVLGKRGHCGT